MNYKFILTTSTLLLSLSVFAQQIPLGSCGIVNIYDATGSRTKRVYFCNNGTDPYPQSIVRNQQQRTVDEAKIETGNFQQIDALYPNPTSGKFFVTFSKAVDNATILILDEVGKIITHVRAKGYKAEFDLSARAAGIYFVRITDKGKITITKKVVKQ